MRTWPLLLRFSGVFSLLTSLALLAACRTLDREAHADALAQQANLVRELIRTDDFVLTAYVRITNVAAPVNVYIEGDGLAWTSRNEPSLDPTPIEATGLKLATADPGANVAYVARPCQFTPLTLNPHCEVTYWTNKRFSPEVVTALNQALDQLISRRPGQRINLIGYSGGGALAVLLAARRSDVTSIRTVAGNLDHQFVNQLHHVSAMPESLNAMDVASSVANLAQIHFSGSNDVVVPPEVAQRFIAATGSRCAQFHIVPGLKHAGDWQRVWPALLAITPVCTGTPARNG